MEKIWSGGGLADSTDSDARCVPTQMQYSGDKNRERVTGIESGDGDREW